MKRIKYKGFIIETEGFIRIPKADISGSIAKVLVTKNKKTVFFWFAVGVLEKAKIEISKQGLIKMAIDKVKRMIDLGHWKPWEQYTFELRDRQFSKVKNPKWWMPAKSIDGLGKKLKDLRKLKAKLSH